MMTKEEHIKYIIDAAATKYFKGYMDAEINENTGEVIVPEGYYTQKEAWNVLADLQPRVSEKVTHTGRWWTEYVNVVQVLDKFYAFVTAKTSGDMSVYERGWEADYDFWEVTPVEIKTIDYVRVLEKTQT